MNELTDTEWEYYYELKKLSPSSITTNEVKQLIFNQVKCGAISLDLFLQLTNDLRI